MLKLNKSELENLYYNHTNDYVCEKLGVTTVTLLKYIKQAGITPKGKGSHMRKIEIVG